MAYRDEIDHSKKDPYGKSGTSPSSSRVGLWGGVAVAIGLVLVLIVALSFVGGTADDGAPSQATTEQTAPAATDDAAPAATDDAAPAQTGTAAPTE